MTQTAMAARTTLCVGLLFAVGCAGLSYFEVREPVELSKVTGGKTIVPMKNPDAPSSQPYRDVFEKYWTANELVVVSYEESGNFVQPGNSVFDRGGRTITVTTSEPGRAGLSTKHVHIYHRLWLVTDEPESGDELRDVAKVLIQEPLHPDFEILMNPDLLNDLDYDTGGRIRNWSPGYLKGFLQRVQAAIASGSQPPPKSPKSICRLAEETLYLSDQNLVKFAAMSGDESKRHDPEDLFEYYPHAYEVLPHDELSNRILDDEASILYLLYAKDNTDKYVSVVESKTGEIVYGFAKSISYNIGSNDLRKVARAVAKCVKAANSSES